MAVYQRPCSAMMIADACLLASISAAISLAARSDAIRSCVFAALELMNGETLRRWLAKLREEGGST